MAHQLTGTGVIGGASRLSMSTAMQRRRETGKTVARLEAAQEGT